MTFGRAFRLVAVILGVLTLGLGVACAVTALRTRSFVATSSTAPGQVVELVSRQSCGRDAQDREQSCTWVYAPRVRFSTADGRRVVFLSSTASSPPAYAEGDDVPVRYRTANPADAQIDSVTSVWLGTMVTGGLTAVFALLCGVWVVLAVRFRTL